MSRGEYVPISEAADRQHEHVSWSITLPEYARGQNIGVNLDRLDRLARIGGFSHIAIANYSGAVTQDRKLIPGLGQFGQAHFEEGEAAPEVKTWQTDIPPLAPGLPRAFFQPDAKLSLNINEIDMKVSAEGGLHSSEAWSKILDTNVRSGVRGLTREHLLKDATRDDRYFFVGPFVMPSISTAQAIGLDRPGYLLYGAAYGVAGYAVMDLVMNSYGKARGFSSKDKRHSLFLGIQLDRVLAVEALSRTAPLVKDLRGKKTGKTSGA